MNGTLQRQQSNGEWYDVETDHIERFLALCAEHNGADAAGAVVPRHRAVRDLDRNEIIGALSAGKVLRNDSADWYSNCRLRRPEATCAAAQPDLVMCDCGHRIERIIVMRASRGTCCPDCYDHMSD
jgi:hypothetical protein